MLTVQLELQMELIQEGLEVWFGRQQGCMNTLEVHPTLSDQIKEKQSEDVMLIKISGEVQVGKAPGFVIQDDGSLWFQNRICVPAIDELRKTILKEAHSSAYSIHPGASKMYKDLRRNFWWPNMKQDVAEFISRCLVCQKVKIEHRRPGGKLQSLPVLEWK